MMVIHNKRLLILLLLVSVPAFSNGQTANTGEKYKGEIRDRSSNAPLEDVYVILNGTSEGTITNVDGYFEISIPPGARADTLRITHLGYSLEMIPLDRLSHQKVNFISLIPSSTMLDEVVISGAGVSAHEILNKVRESLSINFVEKPFSCELFYRHQRDSNDSLQYIEEAAIDFYDSRGFKREAKSKILAGKFLQVKQLRKSTSRDKNQYVSLWDLPVFWTSDPVLSINNVLSQGQEKDYSLEVTGSKVYGDTEVIEIAFSCGKPSVANSGYGFPSPLVYEGKLFVDHETYAIVKYVATIKWKEKLVKDKKFLSRFDVLNTSDFKRSADIEFSYKKFGGSYYLHYAKMRDYFRFTDVQTGDSTTRSYNNELLNVRTNVQNPKILSETILRVDTKDIPFDPTFWETFNFISEVRKRNR